MFSTLDEIKTQILASEDSLAEFKELCFRNRNIISPNTEDIAGELVALANTEGGALFLGVQDNGEIQGISKNQLDSVEKWLINIATNNCDPPIRPIIRKFVLPNPDKQRVEIMLAIISKSLYVHRTSGGRWYTRVGSTKRDLTQQELARLFQQRGRSFVFDESFVPAAMQKDLN
ncbi:MAG: helix-turn-helix domain-containing protein [bacterium]